MDQNNFTEVKYFDNLYYNDLFFIDENDQDEIENNQLTNSFQSCMESDSFDNNDCNNQFNCSQDHIAPNNFGNTQQHIINDQFNDSNESFSADQQLSENNFLPINYPDRGLMNFSCNQPNQNEIKRHKYEIGTYGKNLEKGFTRILRIKKLSMQEKN